jgi:tetratricopeptide (TPR) repeat protein
VRAYASHLGLSAAAVSNWERRQERARLRTETQQILDADLSRAPDEVRERFEAALAEPPTLGVPLPPSDRSTVVPGPPIRHDVTDTDDMKRRELLRLMSMTAGLLGAPGVAGIDWERVGFFADGGRRLDASSVEALAAVNAELWNVFSLAAVKADVAGPVEHQLTLLMTNLRRLQDPGVRERLCAVAADLLQLAGELAFDANRYGDAAYWYSLAASASREAAAYDLWACALTRHAYISVYEREFRDAAPLLDLAAALAGNGDTSLSTRQWVQTVRAETSAGLGDLEECERALDLAEEVHRMTGPIHNGGWLRFDGSRLAEERGRCYVDLERPDLADPVLETALKQKLSARRRGTVLTDLAMMGVQRSDPQQVVMYGDAALDIARHSGSAVVGSRLQRLRPHLARFTTDRHVRHLDTQIATLAGSPVT